jgi:hypothetical protein
MTARKGLVCFVKSLELGSSREKNSLNSFLFISLNPDFPYQVVQINFMAVQGEYGKIIGVVRRKSCSVTV